MADTEFKQRIQEWVTLKKQLKEVRNDISTLNKREKELKKFLQVYMKNNGIDVCNLQDAKVRYTRRKVKKPFNRASVKAGLLRYFNGNEETVNEVIKVIEGGIGAENKETLSIHV